MSARKRKFYLLSDDGEVIGIYRGTSPSQAAKKIALRYGGTKDNPKEAQILDKEKNRIHVYEIWVERVEITDEQRKKIPAWLGKRGYLEYGKCRKIETLS